MDELAKFELEVLLASSPSSTHAELRLLHHILHELKEIRLELKPRLYPVSATITQGDTMLTGTIKGLLPGASDTFFATLIDINGAADALPAGSPVPTWATDAGNGATLAPAADGLSVVATAATNATAGSTLNLTFSATFTKQDGTPGSISKTVNVPILAPPSLDPVDVVISQGAPAA